jgi:hypothetical protein
MLFAVQNIGLAVPAAKAHAYLADPATLPEWTNAFAQVGEAGKALLRTPQGEVPIELDVRSDLGSGIVDWYMTFPDGSLATAHSRIVALSEGTCAYSFLLTPPPVPLEALEGALEQQTGILAEELQKLKAILED